MRERALNPDQVRALYEASARTREQARDRAMLCLCLVAGLRRGEVSALCVRDVDLATGVITSGEGDRGRQMRLGLTTAAALTPFLADRQPGEALLISRVGTPITDRIVHEQLRRLGELAGLGEWVTNRHTRRTYITAIAAAFPAPIALRLIGHVGFRVQAATVDSALQAQSRPSWVSPLDDLLEVATHSRAA